MSKDEDKREKIREMFLDYSTLADIARVLKVSRQRVKALVDEVVPKKEQNYIKAMRSNEKRYASRLAEIKKHYGK